MSPQPVRVLQVIARLNVGGTAYHVTTLAGCVDQSRFDTLLVTGRLGKDEGSFEDMADRHGAHLERLDSLSPDLNVKADLKALFALIRMMRRFRPDIVHTHTAKAGTLGRLAARLAFVRRPLIVHTYHGHVLSDYFGPAKTRVFRAIERVLAPITDCLIAVSTATAEELVGFGVGRRDRYRVIHNGIDLEPFLAIGPSDGEATRRELGVADDELLVLFVGRLVPIKRVDVLLDAAAHARSQGAPVRVAVVGDGELRAQLEAQTHALGLDDFVTFLGFRRDLPVLTAAADLAVLCSDNEAMGMALVEAAAAGKPAIGTDVGGVAEVVPTDALVGKGDALGLGKKMAEAACDRAALVTRGAEARELVRYEYSDRRLVADIETLYDELLFARRRNRAQQPWRVASRYVTRSHSAPISPSNRR